MGGRKQEVWGCERCRAHTDNTPWVNLPNVRVEWPVLWNNTTEHTGIILGFIQHTHTQTFTHTHAPPLQPQILILLFFKPQVATWLRWSHSCDISYIFLLHLCLLHCSETCDSLENKRNVLKMKYLSKSLYWRMTRKLHKTEILS